MDGSDLQHSPNNNRERRTPRYNRFPVGPTTDVYFKFALPFPFVLRGRTEGYAIPRVHENQTTVATSSPSARPVTDLSNCRAWRRHLRCREKRAEPVPFGTILRDGAPISASVHAEARGLGGGWASAAKCFGRASPRKHLRRFAAMLCFLPCCFPRRSKA